MPGTVLRTLLVFYINSFHLYNNPRRFVVVLVPRDPEETEAQKDQLHLSCVTELALLELPYPSSAGCLQTGTEPPGASGSSRC